MPKQPLAEIFGFPAAICRPEAERYRTNKLCPYNNKVPSCTKDKAKNPLGVCTVFDGDSVAITCPIRFRQDWFIIEDAAHFLFPPGVSWTSIQEIRLNDANGHPQATSTLCWSLTIIAGASRTLARWKFRESISQAMCASHSSVTWPIGSAAQR